MSPLGWAAILMALLSIVFSVMAVRGQRAITRRLREVAALNADTARTLHKVKALSTQKERRDR